MQKKCFLIDEIGYTHLTEYLAYIVTVSAEITGNDCKVAVAEPPLSHHPRDYLRSFTDLTERIGSNKKMDILWLIRILCVLPSHKVGLKVCKILRNGKSSPWLSEIHVWNPDRGRYRNTDLTGNTRKLTDHLTTHREKIRLSVFSERVIPRVKSYRHIHLPAQLHQLLDQNELDRSEPGKPIQHYDGVPKELRPVGDTGKNIRYLLGCHIGVAIEIVSELLIDELYIVQLQPQLGRV